MLYHFFTFEFINNGERDEITITALNYPKAVEAFKIGFPDAEIINTEIEW